MKRSGEGSQFQGQSQSQHLTQTQSFTYNDKIPENISSKNQLCQKSPKPQSMMQLAASQTQYAPNLSQAFEKMSLADMPDTGFVAELEEKTFAILQDVFGDGVLKKIQEIKFETESILQTILSEKEQEIQQKLQEIEQKMPKISAIIKDKDKTISEIRIEIKKKFKSQYDINDEMLDGILLLVEKKRLKENRQETDPSYFEKFYIMQILQIFKQELKNPNIYLDFYLDTSFPFFKEQTVAIPNMMEIKTIDISYIHLNIKYIVIASSLIAISAFLLNQKDLENFLEEKYGEKVDLETFLEKECAGKKEKVYKEFLSEKEKIIHDLSSILRTGSCDQNIRGGINDFLQKKKKDIHRKDVTKDIEELEDLEVLIADIDSSSKIKDNIKICFEFLSKIQDIENKKKNKINFYRRLYIKTIIDELILNLESKTNSKIICKLKDISEKLEIETKKEKIQQRILKHIEQLKKFKEQINTYDKENNFKNYTTKFDHWISYFPEIYKMFLKKIEKERNSVYIWCSWCKDIKKTIQEQENDFKEIESYIESKNQEFNRIQ